jgi:predicted amidophosphoribosyltransferase
MDLLKRLDRGYNQSVLLAEPFAKMINRPVMSVLKRSKGSFSQAGLNYEQRLKLAPEAFYAVDTELLRDKTVLLIDDVMTTGSTLRCCAEALYKLHPKSVYALTVCRAL